MASRLLLIKIKSRRGINSQAFVKCENGWLIVLNAARKAVVEKSFRAILRWAPNPLGGDFNCVHFHRHIYGSSWNARVLLISLAGYKQKYSPANEIDKCRSMKSYFIFHSASKIFFINRINHFNASFIIVPTGNQLESGMRLQKLESNLNPMNCFIIYRRKSAEKFEKHFSPRRQIISRFFSDLLREKLSFCFWVKFAHKLKMLFHRCGEK